jgi:hypothetical protein
MLPAPARGSHLSAPFRTNRQSTNYVFYLPDDRMDDDFDVYIVLTQCVFDFSAPTVGKCGSMDLVDDDECLTWTEKVGWVSGPSPSPSFQ